MPTALIRILCGFLIACGSPDSAASGRPSVATSIRAEPATELLNKMVNAYQSLTRYTDQGIVATRVGAAPAESTTFNAAFVRGGPLSVQVCRRSLTYVLGLDRHPNKHCARAPPVLGRRSQGVPVTRSCSSRGHGRHQWDCGARLKLTIAWSTRRIEPRSAAADNNRGGRRYRRPPLYEAPRLPVESVPY